MVITHSGYRRIRTVFLFACTLLTVGCSERPTLEVSQKFQQAEKLFAEAESPEDYKRVAARYQEILDTGFRSGIIYYNQGNAWLQAGEPGRAIAAYRLAQRQLPRDPYLEANLHKARQSGSNLTSEAVPLLNHVFFWQRSVSYWEKMLVFTGLLSIFLTLVALSQLQKDRSSIRKLVLVAAVPMMLLAASIARDWSAFENTTHGVIVDDIVARKGGSDSYDSAFMQPLKDGTEFVLLNRQADWLHIQISENATGWIPERAAVTY